MGRKGTDDMLQARIIEERGEGGGGETRSREWTRKVWGWVGLSFFFFFFFFFFF